MILKYFKSLNKPEVFGLGAVTGILLYLIIFYPTVTPSKLAQSEISCSISESDKYLALCAETLRECVYEYIKLQEKYL